MRGRRELGRDHRHPRVLGGGRGAGAGIAGDYVRVMRFGCTPAPPAPRAPGCAPPAYWVGREGRGPGVAASLSALSQATVELPYGAVAGRPVCTAGSWGRARVLGGGRKRNR